MCPSRAIRQAFEPIQGTVEQIAGRIRGEIETGRLGPGTPLNQVDLAARFGLSRIPVREALRQLEAEGYVTSRPNKGAIVASAFSHADVLEIVEIRQSLETLLMDHAVPLLTPEVLREAADSLAALNRATSADQLQGAHERFHTILFSAGNRPRMAEIINGWRFNLDRSPDVDDRRKRAFARATRDVHERLLEALGKRDRRAVQRCVADEYAIVLSTLVQSRTAS